MSELPRNVGPYTVVATLGEGGMGVVYLAEQVAPVRRTVALKLLRAELGSEQVLARFQAERQALAIMDHPGIAKVFDAGVTEEGHPYFAMEYVEGAPITRFCDERRMPLRLRVRTFVDLCHAVQHAHQKGLIHRDLKPSNILVSEVDGRPLPRVIDFGIAKAVGGDDFDGTTLTRVDQIIGTPAYMSPEQVEGSADIDTRSDVYALGVLLYELLVGALPFDSDAYRGWGAIVAALHGQPSPPSRRVAELSETQQTVAALRSTTVGSLRSGLKGDLEYIISRAMERDRSQRYETANALALDLERFLAHEPVRARGRSRLYVARKFVRRHRVGVAFASTLLLGLAAFAATTFVQARSIARARDLAEARRSQAEGLVDFMLGDLREKLAPIGRLELLDDVGRQALAYFETLPESEFTETELLSRSKALDQIGQVRLNLGDAGGALSALDASLQLASELHRRAPDDPDRLFQLSQSNFWVGYAAWRHGDLDAAEQRFLAYLDNAERLVRFDPDNLTYQMELGYAHSNLGSVREARGDLLGAVEAYERTLAVKQDLVAQDSSNVDWVGELAETYNTLGVVVAKLGNYSEALERHQAELALKQGILIRDPRHAYWRYRLAMTHHFLSKVRGAIGDIPGALGAQRTVTAILDSLVVHDPSNAEWRRSSAIAHQRLGTWLIRTGQAREGRAELSEARVRAEALVRDDSTAFDWKQVLASVHTATARALHAMGDPEGALREAQRAGELLGPSSDGATATDVARAEQALARARALEGLARPTEAAEAAGQALGLLDPLLAASEDVELRVLRTEALLMMGRSDEALAEFGRLTSGGYVNPDLAALASRKKEEEAASGRPDQPDLNPN